MLGFLLGAQILIEGMTLIAAGRVRFVRPEPATPPADLPAVPA